MLSLTLVVLFGVNDKHKDGEDHNADGNANQNE